MSPQMRNVRAIKEAPELLAYARSIGLDLPFDERLIGGPESPLAQPVELNGRTIGNRWAILPMEGWDNTTDGRPTEYTRRRWRRWGASGAKLIFGAEAVAVCPDGRGSPVQLLMSEKNVKEIGELRESLAQSHRERFGSADDLFIGTQLTHSGRVSRPNDWGTPEPRILYHHPILDPRYGAEGDDALMTDAEIERVIGDFVAAARLSQEAGFDFVDIKHCHGYLGHEFLSAVDRSGPYGGSFENRTRFLREIVAGIRSQAPGLEIAVRLSALDFLPFEDGADDRTAPVPLDGGYRYAFGGDGSGLGSDLTEPLAFLDLLSALGIRLVCISAGAEYNSHLMEPYVSLPVAAHKPPEDPLVGVARLISLVAELKRLRPELVYVGSGYSYLQQWLPNVAQAVVAGGLADFVGIGRLSFSYPDVLADLLEGKPVQQKRLCRTCGFCDMAPAFGIKSGCYALDDFYKDSPEWRELKQRFREA
jgi:NADPH2 dehydrogenase